VHPSPAGGPGPAAAAAPTVTVVSPEPSYHVSLAVPYETLVTRPAGHPGPGPGRGGWYGCEPGPRVEPRGPEPRPTVTASSKRVRPGARTPSRRRHSGHGATVRSRSSHVVVAGPGDSEHSPSRAPPASEPRLSTVTAYRDRPARAQSGRWHSAGRKVVVIRNPSRASSLLLTVGPRRGQRRRDTGPGDGGTRGIRGIVDPMATAS
jgi:hypothetical protein